MGEGLLFCTAAGDALYLFLQEPTLWAMGVAHALKAIAHRVGSYN